ncbi:MAG: glycosyltransferase N-terminal domain-containing protein [Burkholderiaceae bacterium]
MLLTHATPTGLENRTGLVRRRRVSAPTCLRSSVAGSALLRRYRPRLGIILETELWPNLVAEARRAGVPLALVNARLSERSLRKGRWPALIPPALRGLDLVAAQTDGDAGGCAAPRGGRRHHKQPEVRPGSTPALEALGRRWRMAVTAAGDHAGQQPRRRGGGGAGRLAGHGRAGRNGTRPAIRRAAALYRAASSAALR